MPERVWVLSCSASFPSASPFLVGLSLMIAVDLEVSGSLAVPPKGSSSITRCSGCVSISPAGSPRVRGAGPDPGVLHPLWGPPRSSVGWPGRAEEQHRERSWGSTDTLCQTQGKQHPRIAAMQKFLQCCCAPKLARASLGHLAQLSVWPPP